MIGLSGLGTVFHYSFFEIYKSKIMLNVFFIALGLALMSYISSELTYGITKKIVLDLGLGSITLSSVIISIFMGNYLLSKEIERKTIYMIISRPISRGTLFIGKFFAMSAIILINVLILGSLIIFIYLMLGGEFRLSIIYAIATSYLESIVLLSIVLMFSLICNNVLTVIFSILIYISGHVIPEIIDTSFVKNNLFAKKFISVYMFFMPTFDKLNIKRYVLYENTIPENYIIWAFIYGMFFTVLFLMISVAIFKRKNFD